MTTTRTDLLTGRVALICDRCSHPYMSMGVTTVCGQCQVPDAAIARPLTFLELRLAYQRHKERHEPLCAMPQVG